MRWFCVSLILGSCLSWAGEPEPPALADALWKGRMEIRIQGELRNHFLANRMGDHGPTGFLQEKSKMDLEFVLLVNFFVNNVGEVSKAASVAFKGEQLSNSEENFRFIEEVELEGGIKATQEVLQKESKTTRVLFEVPEKAAQLSNSELNILPNGRIDKKGNLTFEGNLSFEYQGQGGYVLQKERQPPSEEFAVLEERANLTRTLALPISFSSSVDFRKKAVETSFPVQVEFQNPFQREDSSGKDIFVDDVSATCKVSLTPLFGK